MYNSNYKRKTKKDVSEPRSVRRYWVYAMCDIGTGVFQASEYEPCNDIKTAMRCIEGFIHKYSNVYTAWISTDNNEIVWHASFIDSMGLRRGSPLILTSEKIRAELN